MPGELSTPSGVLYRIGRAPRPLDLPPWDKVGTGRFDDPRPSASYRMHYVGERSACFYESLASFRVGLDGIASQGITEEWLERRRIASFQLVDRSQSLRWLDLASPETYFEFRSTFGTRLRRLGFSDFDVSAATSDKRELTQSVGQWAHDRGYAGIRCITRHAPLLDCWAIFEGIPFDILDAGSTIASADADLQVVALQWQLPLP
jgi:hypothetical protein